MLDTLKLLLPALIPSWRFFKSVQPSPRLQWRYCNDPADTDWQEFRPRPDHLPIREILTRLFWNPGWNETLYTVSLAERLTVDPTPHAEREVFRLIAARLAGMDQAQSVQFQLVFVTRNSADITYQSQPRTLSEITG